MITKKMHIENISIEKTTTTTTTTTTMRELPFCSSILNSHGKWQSIHGG
jgi:hypothetical protein